MWLQGLLQHSLLSSPKRALPNLLRIMFHPTRVWKILRKLLLGLGNDVVI